MFARIWPAGVPENGPIPHGDITDLDIRLTRTLDTYGGGSYYLGAPIKFYDSQLWIGNDLCLVSGGYLFANAGSSVQSAATADWKGTFTFGGASATKITLGAFAGVDFESGADLVFKAGSTVTSNASTQWLGNYVFAASAGITVGCNLSIQSTSTVISDPGTTWNGTFEFDNAAHVNVNHFFQIKNGAGAYILDGGAFDSLAGSTFSLRGASTTYSPFKTSGAGRFVRSRSLVMGDGSVTAGPANYDHVHVPNATFSADRYFRLPASAEDGDEITFACFENGFELDVQKSDASSLLKMKSNLAGNGPLAGCYRFATVRYITGTGWVVRSGWAKES